MIENSQPLPTPTPFQLQLTVNSSKYSQYEAPYLQNVEFTYQNFTVIPSWLETGNLNVANYTVYWLRINGGIPAESNLIIYMAFAPISTNLFDGVNVGEAPGLSTTYGQYDNGQNVFDVYANFVAPNLPVNWTPQGSASFVSGQGVETVNGTNGEEGAIIYEGNVTARNIILEASTSYNGGADMQNFGFYCSQPSTTNGGYTGGVGSGGTALNGYTAGFDPYAGSAWLIYNGISTSQVTFVGAGTYDFLTQITLGSSSIVWNVAQGSSPYQAGEYSGLQTLVSYDSSPINSLGGLFFSSTTGGSTSTQFIYWLRIRAQPPNDVMPTSSFDVPITINADGSVTPTIAPVSTSDNVTYTLTGNIKTSLVVERDNVTVDGAGYTLQGIGSGNGIELEEREKVTIKNLQIDGFQLGIGLYSSNDINISGIVINANTGDGISLYNLSATIISGNSIESNTGSGIYLNSSSGNTISGNNISSNAASGIYLYSSNGTTILGNNITNNMVGVDLLSSSGNSIYHNNFVSNGLQVYVDSVNVWDNGYPSGGNYWNDYLTKYPNSSEVDNSGIWNNSYVIDPNNIDRYPLQQIFTVVPEFPSMILLPLFMIITMLAVITASRRRHLTYSYR